MYGISDVVELQGHVHAQLMPYRISSCSSCAVFIRVDMLSRLRRAQTRM